MLPGFTPALFKGAAAGADAFTVLLLHGDTTGSPAILDYSPKNKGYATAVGVAPLQSATQKKFGTASINFAANGAFTFPHSTDFEFGTGDFTIEWFEYRSGGGCAVARDATNTYNPFLLSFGASRQIYMSSTGSSWDVANARSFGTVTNNVWAHLAITRSGTTFRAFKDGVQTDTWTSSASLLARTTPFCVGTAQNTQYFNGYIDELRVSKGIARWTANFTPPAAPYDPATQPGAPTLPTQTIILTAGSSWVVPLDWNNSNNAIECYGGGAGGGAGYTNGTADGGGGSGGGGGGYSKIINWTLTPGSTVSYNIGAPGPGGNPGGSATAGGDTWFVNTSTVLAKGGQPGSSPIGPLGVGGGAGGAAGSGVGTTKFSGGDGGGASGWTNGNGNGSGGSGGGSSAGPTVNGNPGDTFVDGIKLGVGGASVGGLSGKGGDGSGKGFSGSTSPGGPGSNYGGGGAGGSVNNGSMSLGGNGAPGAIRITYGG